MPGLDGLEATADFVSDETWAQTKPTLPP
jgi:hypothetical protein